ncbi:MAG: hypothetical protein BGO90_12730 [Legionella sp. 40-6]|nr:hypothetical protein [Legionella sp.]OJY20060.1 MAG: hypothetical protein BGO90_12730 [Legionella sp. 40-6]
MRSLIKTPTYENEAVIDYFCAKNPAYEQAAAQELFKDLLSWLLFNQKRAHENKKTHLFGPLLDLDEMWHAFILHTRAYTEFCLQYLGEYLHHDIEPVGYEHLIREEELRGYLEDCFQFLGIDWVSRRFALALEAGY